MIDSLKITFIAALQSVGTAATMTFTGIYLHRRGFISSEGKKTLAKLSQQITIPALFFSKIIYCPQDFSNKECPNVTNNLRDVWVLAFWPLYVVGCGLLVGKVACRLVNTPPWQRRSVIAACAFGNSTGLPITLLTVIHANFPKTSEIGKVDPNLFLSVYLLLYPILQWGIGGWLLAPGDETTIFYEDTTTPTNVIHHVLNIDEQDQDGACVVKEIALTDLLVAKEHDSTTETSGTSTPPETDNLLVSELEHNGVAPSANYAASLFETLFKVLPKAFQPPVIGALSGLFIASIPKLRGCFVDVITRSEKAPLEWLFDGIYSVGQAAVPINMTILGVNLSLAAQNKNTDNPANTISNRTIAAVVFGKMVAMPIIGILSTLVLKNYIWNIPEDIDKAFYLVLMIVCITPTANNVMVMVELNGSGTRRGMAKIIAWQYAVAPIILSITVMLIVRVACLW